MSTSQTNHSVSFNEENSSEDTVAVNKTPKAREKKKAASAFRTISEVADELDVQQHVLRFWETKFTQVKPLKRGGGRRYYRPEDVEILRRIHHLLYTEGYTIKGVQKLLKGQGKQQVIENTPAVSKSHAANETGEPAAARSPHAAVPLQGGLNSKQRSILEAMLGDLKELRSMIKTDD